MNQIRVATFDEPGAPPKIRLVDRPKVPANAALFEVGACGVCGTDLHILKGHWPTPLPWPFTLGHEVAGIIVEKGAELTHDYMGRTLEVGCKIMIPPFMPCGNCYYCVHYPETATKCLTPVYYGRYLGFNKSPHLWGGWAEAEYLDLDMLPGTKIYRLPDDMPLWLGTLAEPLTSSIRAFSRAQKMGCFRVGDTVVIQGSGPIGVLAIVAAKEMGAGRVVMVGAPEEPRLRLGRAFGAEATVDIEEHESAETRIAAVRDIVGGFGADITVDCSGHPSAGPEGIEMLRDGGTYIEMGQFTDAGSIETNWHRFCVKDINMIGSWAFTADDIAREIAIPSASFRLAFRSAKRAYRRRSTQPMRCAASRQQSWSIPRLSSELVTRMPRRFTGPVDLGMRPSVAAEQRRASRAAMLERITQRRLCCIERTEASDE